MSIFNPASMPCPVCGTPKNFDLVASVNADRRPDLRAAIMAGTFQRQRCESCGSPFRTPPLMTYLDMGRHQWILAQPASDLPQWRALEAKARSVFAVAYGEKAPTVARELGREMRARVVFGWSALSEKLLCSEHGLDDVNLELLKLAVLREVPDSPLDDLNELRLTGVEGGEMILDWINPEDEQSSGSIRVPRELYDEVAADQGDWQPLRDELSADPFVDFQRLMMADPAPEPDTESTEPPPPAKQEEEPPEDIPAGKKPKASARSKKAPPAKGAGRSKAVPSKKAKRK
jgi:hypothetical protein